MEVFEFLMPIFTEYGYLAVFVMLLICGFGVPVPEDVTLVTGGVIAGLGHADVHTRFAVGMAGVLIGDGLMFTLGRLYGERIRFVLADPSNSLDFLNHMGIKPEDAPMVVLHDTARNDAKRFLPRDKVGGANGGKAVRAFIDEYMGSISAPAPAEDKQEL